MKILLNRLNTLCWLIIKKLSSFFNESFAKKQRFPENIQIVSIEIGDILTSIRYNHTIIDWSTYAPDEKFWETFAMRVLNCTYWWKLKRLEEEKTNADVIDLYDNENAICIQVTKEITPNKIQKTISGFEEKKMYNTFQGIKFFLVTNNNPFPQKKFTTNWEYNFNKTTDLITFKTLNKVKDSKDLDTLKQLRNILLEYSKDINSKERSYQALKIKNEFERAENEKKERGKVSQEKKEILQIIEKHGTEDLKEKIKDMGYNSEWWADPAIFKS